MSFDSFSAQCATDLSVLNKGDKIHVIGICGVAMAQIAVALHGLGFIVSGSDKEYYEPMGSLLRRFPIALCDGFKGENIPDDVSLVVIGNSISYPNPEIAIIEERGLPYTFFPKLLSEVVIRNNHSIVVTGTHGKTTTSALGAEVLYHAKKDPSYFIGGAAKGLPDSLHVGGGAVSIVEGDEYDSAFFAKVPKFNFYRPDTLVITSIEYDHADIYPELDAIIKVFDNLVQTIPKNGTIIVCADCENVRRLAKTWRTEASGKVITYGSSHEAEVQITARSWKDGYQNITLKGDDLKIVLQTPLLGEHNARNVVSIYLACRSAGLSNEEILSGLRLFKGVKRRQDVRAERMGITLIEDFAHHPTAVFETLRALRERYDSNRIIAVFEPRSNTSRRNVFQDAYVKAFESADRVVLSEVSGRKSDEGHELMNVAELAARISDSGVPAAAVVGTDTICETLKVEMARGDVIVIMSNGSFGGLIDDLLEHILRI